jgi:hypothetical protein
MVFLFHGEHSQRTARNSRRVRTNQVRDADLLGRRAQSLIEWETRGIPREKRASVERLLDLAQLFRKRVIASRIPEIVRTPDPWLGNRTILETLRVDGVDPIYAYLGRLFNYGGM